MPIQFQQRRLDNGLTVLAECNPDAHTAAVGFFVKTGTRDEDKPAMGVSHFLEHMVFKGTDSRSADDVNRQFDAMGANYNAFTTHEMTAYYAHVLPEYLPRAVELIADILRPALRGSDFDMEKQVILEEIGMYNDRPHWRLQDELLEKYFGSHSLGYRVLGTNASIQALTADQMRGYFAQRYSPDNIVVSAAGRLDFDAFIGDVAGRTGSWRPAGAQRAYVEPAVADNAATIRDERTNRHYLSVMMPAPSAQDPRRYAAKVLADVLGDVDGSRIYWALVDPGLADEADMAFVPYDRVGAYYAYASCDPDRADAVEAKLLEVIDGCVATLDDDEIERAKNKLATLATLQDEQPAGRMRAIGGQWTYLGEYIPLQVELDRLMSVTADDIRALVAAMPFKPRTIVRLTPSNTP